MEGSIIALGLCYNVSLFWGTDEYNFSQLFKRDVYSIEHYMVLDQFYPLARVILVFQDTKNILQTLVLGCQRDIWEFCLYKSQLIKDLANRHFICRNNFSASMLYTHFQFPVCLNYKPGEWCKLYCLNLICCFIFFSFSFPGPLFAHSCPFKFSSSDSE